MSESTSQLVSDVVRGDVHLFGELVKRFDARVRQSVAKKVFNSSTVEDLVQETFYKAFKQIGSLSDPYRFEGWLLTIAKRCVADFYRRRTLPQMAGDEPLDAASQTLESNTNPDWIWEEVDSLSLEQVQVLQLRYRLSLTYTEIAARLEVSEATVRGRIFEARKSLRKRLTDRKLFP